MSDEATGPQPTPDGFGPVPSCKGCGSTNLVCVTRATITSEYSSPIGVRNGSLHFKHSYSGYGENERFTYQCEACGRKMRLRLWPVEATRD